MERVLTVVGRVGLLLMALMVAGCGSSTFSEQVTEGIALTTAPQAYGIQPAPVAGPYGVSRFPERAYVPNPGCRWTGNQDFPLGARYFRDEDAVKALIEEAYTQRVAYCQAAHGGVGASITWQERVKAAADEVMRGRYLRTQGCTVENLVAERRVSESQFGWRYPWDPAHAGQMEYVCRVPGAVRRVYLPTPTDGLLAMGLGPDLMAYVQAVR